jgi:hypothetical protein
VQEVVRDDTADELDRREGRQNIDENVDVVLALVVRELIDQKTSKDLQDDDQQGEGKPATNSLCVGGSPH